MKKSTSILLIIIALLIIALALLYVADRSFGPATNPTLGTTAASSTPVATLPSDFQIYENTTDGFSVYYPTDIATLTQGNTSNDQDWSYNATVNEPGNLDVTVSIPASFEPMTNFNEGRFTVGTSVNSVAVAECLTAPEGDDVTQSSAIINGVGFTEFHYGDAGAGNIYDITSYRAINAGKCYAVEYVIHSADIGDYSADQHIAAFDQAKVQDILEEMVHSFKFN